MSTRKDRRPLPLLFLMAGLVFQGISGLYGGGALVWDPTGELLAMPLDLLESSPFASYRIPGLILFSILGAGPLIVVVAVWKRAAWAWFGSVAVAVALIVWIGVEIVTVGYHADPPLQALYGGLGMLLLAASLLPSVRAFLRAD